MQNKRIILIFFLALISRFSLAQDSTVIEQYINTYKDLAIAEMQRTGVPASIKLAQGIHETLAGTSDLVKKSNNHFGIKCKDTWTGESVKHNDDLRNECFRKYSSAEESYRDHSDFLKNSPRYSPLFELDPTDYKDWAYGLKKAGYATNPRYSQVIIKLIEDYHLQDYTLMALGKMKPQDEVLAKVTPTVNVSKQGSTTSMAFVKNEEPSKNVVTTKTETPVGQKDGFLNMEVQVKKEEPKQEVKQPEKIVEQPTYPAGEFKINDTRVVYVKKGTPFLAIAQQYNIQLAWLFDFNDIKETEAVNKDQLIYLQRKRKTGNNEFHIVKIGETLYDIAQTEAIRIESLLEYNMLNENMQPAPGVQLYLKTKAPAAPRLVAKENNSSRIVQDALAMNSATKNNSTDLLSDTKENDRFISYIVQPKETIYSIAKKYQVKIDDLVKWNQLSGYELRSGQSLKIYK